MRNTSIVVGAVASVLGAASVASNAWAAELNVLAWCDHADASLLEPFEKAHDTKVNVKEFEGTGAAISILEQSRPGDWDVVTIDTVDVRRLVERNLFKELPSEQLATSDQFPEVVMQDRNAIGGKTYAITEKFGYNTISFDKTKVDPKDMDDLSSLWSGKYDKKIAIYDYYLPIIGLVGLEEGVKSEDITEDKIPALREKLLSLKQRSKQIGDIVSSQTALATGEADILVGGGEWITGTLQGEKPNLDWTIPKQGAMRWSQSIGVAKDSAQPDLALEFVKYITSPEAQAKLATSSCYWAMPANKKAGEYLTDEQKAALRWKEQADYLARTSLYPAPSEALDAKLQDLWTEVLQN
ncbi:extracellular solute-binding protein [Rhizobium sp. CCGE 510]|uniref:ABC transporter substrate-binding protein n=1 Tax=Rhizobium sp. CCGE 510 TaxID=1132836 RepID=UPI00027B8179|nr:extracellular solute-binding protein [Rhizobium sp. CCGE 510]EJT04256.1 spermidine/putrescine transport system substrate-binding protein [Rhizobium sp. CCGE 510]